MDGFVDAYNLQKGLQLKINSALPDDNLESPVLMYNSATAAMVEIGEMLQEDTRWKYLVTGSKKEPVYDKDKFLEEWCDAIIYMFNVLIYAGVNIDEAEKVLFKKQFTNLRRFGYDN